MRLAALFLATSLCVPAQTASAHIDALIQDSPAARQAFWGIRVLDAETGEVVYEKNADHFFVPASNTKLYSTALALQKLGPDFRFLTRIMADAQPAANGTLQGDLILLGGGDPNLSGRAIPYVKDDPLQDPLAKLRLLADQLVTKGVHSITGDIIGDDTAYAYEPYPPGWAVDDAPYEYGAAVSALTVNDNAVNVIVRAGSAPGDSPVLSFDPPIEPLIVHNRVRTEEAQTRIHYERMPGSNELTISGVIQLRSQEQKTRLAVDDPALFAAKALRFVLEQHGITVRGRAVARHRRTDETAFPAPAVELARYSSPPLADALRIIDKESQNLHAEMVLREVARQQTGFGTRREALNQLQEFLTEIGVPGKQDHFEDGSGLSRLTLTTPATTAQLLLSMWRSPNRETWVGLLPVGGEDGTLDKRFKGFTDANAVHAKTGSLTHVAALSGYILPPGGRALIFSLMTNNFNAPASEVREIADKIVMGFISSK